ncbi:hypothetical protein [Micromonospora sp. HM5-17]|jgi:hypothetical protein|uniref:hypothetical protein n=1 Tax=Micromonospora sp. HM5-17 TaxID=2487710 RepID=UPI000F49F12E|nr:hypothetical protein [Micromonospora sp. HM5-17]ROT33099.1 hypothetical protein EF879_08180 [Micromonospora sp. HM5-17]
MTLRLARTSAEAYLYMELHPCERCGESDFEPVSAVVSVQGDLASRYTGACPSCGNEREFMFRIPERPLLVDPENPQFGADRPSELLDPGEWLWVADTIASGVPANPDGLSAEQRRDARVDLRGAAAAVGEVLKFIPPDADAVPFEAFDSDRGREVYQTEPGRFRRARLEAVAQTYRELAERFAT